MSDIAIKVENLGKLYHIGAKQERHDTLRDALVATFQRFNLPTFKRSNAPTPDDAFWALRDVSFEVKRGEVVGVIGRNGAGKSTLLKILSRITEPTTGHVEIHGRVGSLLEVGTGFHPELTGRENIYLNGAILGMKRTEIDRKFDEIVAFSEIGKFLDTPVKRYSSGMYVRLAFSVAAHLEPEILLVDEVLAVGDAEFQKKCLGKMGDVAGEGRTVLFVSHNMTAVTSLCSHLVSLAMGSMTFDGEVQQGVRQYLRGNSPFKAEQVWENSGTAPAGEGIRFTFARLVNTVGEVTGEFSNTEEIYVEIGYETLWDISDLYVGYQLCTANGITVLDSHDQDALNLYPDGRRTGRYLGRCRIPPLFLNEGDYLVNLVAYIPKRQLLVFEESALNMHVTYVGGVGPTTNKPGIVRPALSWSVSYEGSL